MNSNAPAQHTVATTSPISAKAAVIAFGAVRTAMRKRKPCSCARCRGVPTADPRWGFDRRDLPKTECLTCGQPIGRRKYRLNTTLARFGIMQVAHVNCP